MSARLAWAIQHNEIAWVEESLRNGLSPSQRCPGHVDDDGNTCWTTPLLKAIAWGRDRIVRLLIDSGADVDAIADDEELPYRTPLELAVALDRHEVASLLLQHGAQVTPLAIHTSVAKGDANMFRLLLSFSGTESEDGTPTLTRDICGQCHSIGENEAFDRFWEAGYVFADNRKGATPPCMWRQDAAIPLPSIHGPIPAKCVYRLEYLMLRASGHRDGTSQNAEADAEGQV